MKVEPEPEAPDEDVGGTASDLFDGLPEMKDSDWLNPQKVMVRWRALDDRLKQKEAEAAALKAATERCSRTMLTYMHNAGVTGLKVEGVGSTSIVELKMGAVEDKDLLIATLREEGLDEYITEEVSKSRLNEMAKARLESGDPMPDGSAWLITERAQFYKTRPRKARARQ